jgi:hypothetical protein
VTEPTSAARPLANAAARLRRPPGRPRKVAGAQASQTPGLSIPADRSQSYKASVPALCPISPRLLDLATAAAYLGVSPWTVRDLEAARIVPRVRMPLPGGGELRKLLFDRDDLDQLIRVWKDAAP